MGMNEGMDGGRLVDLKSDQVVAQIFDAFLYYGLIAVVHVLEDGAPGGHV